MFKHTLMTLVLGAGLTTFLQADTVSLTSNSSSVSQDLLDQELARKVRDKIHHGWFDKGYDQIQVEAKNGIVTLKGEVPTQEDKDKIEEEARNIDRVTGLNSTIKVQQPSQEVREFPQDTYGSAEDDQLNKKIRDAVSIGWFDVDYKSVSLHTSNGVVTLEGTVDSLHEEQKLVSEVQEVEGVKEVKSNLKIQ